MPSAVNIAGNLQCGVHTIRDRCCWSRCFVNRRILLLTDVLETLLCTRAIRTQILAKGKVSQVDIARLRMTYWIDYVQGCQLLWN